MADKVLTWHIPVVIGEGVRQGPTHYVDGDYTPTRLIIHAENAPINGNLEIDILDDGVSILEDRSSTYVTPTYANASLEYNGLTLAFSEQEVVTGGTSGATGYVLTDNGKGSMVLYDTSGTYTADETITGGTSGATATVNAFVAAKRGHVVTSDPEYRWALLIDGDNLETDAEDFVDAAEIADGSMMTCNVGETNGAGNITVHLLMEQV